MCSDNTGGVHILYVNGWHPAIYVLVNINSYGELSSYNIWENDYLYSWRVENMLCDSTGVIVFSGRDDAQDILSFRFDPVSQIQLWGEDGILISENSIGYEGGQYLFSNGTGFLYLWKEEIDNYYKIIGQILNPLGQIICESDLQICNNPSNQYFTRNSTVVSNDDVVISFLDDRIQDSNSEYQIYAQKLDFSCNLSWPDSGRIVSGLNSSTVSTIPTLSEANIVVFDSIDPNGLYCQYVNRYGILGEIVNDDLVIGDINQDLTIDVLDIVIMVMWLVNNTELNSNELIRIRCKPGFGIEYSRYYRYRRANFKLII